MHEFDAVHASLTDFPKHPIENRCWVVPGLLRGEDPKVGTHVDLGFGQGSGESRVSVEFKKNSAPIRGLASRKSFSGSRNACPIRDSRPSAALPPSKARRDRLSITSFPPQDECDDDHSAKRLSSVPLRFNLNRSTNWMRRWLEAAV
jgi:hypothetical protein